MKAKVKLIFYSEDLVDIGSVRLTVLRVIGERYFDKPIELGDRPEESLEKLALELGEGRYVEAVAEAKNQIIRIGVLRKGSQQSSARRTIFYRPSKLLRVGIIESTGEDGEEWGSANIFRGDVERDLGREGVGGEEARGMDHGSQAREPGEVGNITWYSPQGELYVFEGDLRVDGSCETVVIVTEHGERAYFLGGVEEGKPAIVGRAGKATRKKRRKRKKAKGS